jgi:glutathione S-transferase
MKLHGHPLSSCTRKVLLTAAEKDARIDLVPVDLFTGEHKQPAHLARHPFGVVPVLDDAGFVLYESRAIVRYLDARLAGPPLVPADLRDRARIRGTASEARRPRRDASLFQHLHREAAFSCIGWQLIALPGPWVRIREATCHRAEGLPDQLPDHRLANTELLARPVATAHHRRT